MKKLRLLSISLFAGLIFVLLFIVGCTADDFRETPAQTTQVTNSPVPTDNNEAGTDRVASASVCNAYIISLESFDQVGSNWEWIWTVQNPNPGNGNGGTVQNLSHWGMQFGSCFAWSNVVGAAYSADGVSWTTFTPVYQADPSQNCMTTPVLKFDFGTTGTSPSYYKLVLNQSYQPGYVPGYFKSGVRTGCCVFNFTGVGCPAEAEEK